MQWRWLEGHVRHSHDANYAQRVLDRYRLGMKAHGAVRGVRIICGDDSCSVCRAAAASVYHPDEAPIVPVAGCTSPGGCRCSYSPVMTYEEGE
jgi:hypothetical protein